MRSGTRPPRSASPTTGITHSDQQRRYRSSKLAHSADSARSVGVSIIVMSGRILCSSVCAAPKRSTVAASAGGPRRRTGVGCALPSLPVWKSKAPAQCGGHVDLLRGFSLAPGIACGSPAVACCAHRLSCLVQLGEGSSDPGAGCSGLSAALAGVECRPAGSAAALWSRLWRVPCASTRPAMVTEGPR